MADRDSGDEEELTIADDVVVTKYKMAADMANGKDFSTKEVQGHFWVLICYAAF